MECTILLPTGQSGVTVFHRIERRSIMKKTRREFVKLVGGAALGVGVMLSGRGKAMAQAKPLKGVPSEPVKIGVMPGLTGVIGVPGTAGWRTAQFWAEE